MTVSRSKSSSRTRL